MNGNAILLVEDDESDQQLFLNAIKRFGMDVQIAESIKEAKEKLAAYPKYNFVFVDLSLQGMDAMPLIRWIKEHYPYVPVITLTGTDALSAHKQGELRDAGSFRHFKKNITSEQILEIMPIRDLNAENYKLGKPRPSWKTTLFAAIGALLAAGAWAFKMPELMPPSVLFLCTGVAFSADSSVLIEAIKLMELIVASKKKD